MRHVWADILIYLSGQSMAVRLADSFVQFYSLPVLGKAGSPNSLDA